MFHRLICLMLCFLPCLAWADPAQDAFLFADKHNWPEALAHAKRGDPVLLKTITWLYLQDPDAHASFHEVSSFISKNPNWPHQDKLHLRAEQALRNSVVPDGELKEWFTKNPPVSGIGKLKYAETLMQGDANLKDETIRMLLREAWRDGDFEEPEERRLLALYSEVLRPEDHAARASRLLWEEKIKPVLRMQDKLSSAEAALVQARVALIQDKSDAAFRVSRVPPEQARDTGLLYDRLQWRARRGDDAGVRELLLAAPATVPYGRKWWKLRGQAVREAIGAGHYSLAAKLLAHHGQTEGEPLADATWLTGWLALEFQHDPQSAYLQFYHMYDAVSFPVSKARAAYWAGRAAEKTGDGESAKSWYATAASYPTTFYGQLASAHVNGTAPLRFPAAPEVSEAERSAFDKEELPRAIRIAGEARGLDTATVLLYHIIDETKSPARAALAVDLAAHLKGEALGVRAAKRAMQHNVLVITTGYPKRALPEDSPLPPALALAIIRQESEFDPWAKSSAGALGLMQLGPATAKETARKNDLIFTALRLYEPTYNIQLGSAYLARLIKAYDGSYVMAIAAYNAGPGNVRKWIATFDTAPHKSAEDAADWIEKIPYTETRNYVERVTENLQVYKNLLAGKDAPKLTIREDLTRGD